MTREQLEHVIRAAGRIADVQELVIVGSQSALIARIDHAFAAPPKSAGHRNKR